MIRILSESEIEDAVSIEDFVPSLELMFEEMHRERAITDSREDILTPVDDPPEGFDWVEPVYYWLKTMGGVIREFDVGAIRINSDVQHYPRDEDSGTRSSTKVPTVDGRFNGFAILFKISTGEPLVLFPDGVVQTYRVSITSALGAKYLSREDASSVGLIGSGQQARGHLRALDVVRELDDVKVYSPTPAHREAFAEEMADEVRPEVRAVPEAEAVFEDVDIVQVATSSMSPVFDPEWIQPGTHVGVINAREAPDAFFDPGAYDAFVQSWEQLTQVEMMGRRVTERTIPTKNANRYVLEDDEPAPQLQPDYNDEFLCDWTAVPSLGRAIVDDSVGRADPDDVTAFYNRGMGIQFAAIGHTLYETAEEADLGYTVPTELLTQTHHS